jgi:hypothetical protein
MIIYPTERLKEDEKIQLIRKKCAGYVVLMGSAHPEASPQQHRSRRETREVEGMMPQIDWGNTFYVGSGFIAEGKRKLSRSWDNSC